MSSLYLKESREYILANMPKFEEINWGALFVLLMATALIISPEVSLAEDDTVEASVISDTICNVVDQLQGPVARGVAAIGIIFLGFSLFLGKISWGVALALAIGIGAIFGAKELVDLIGGDGEACESTSSSS